VNHQPALFDDRPTSVAEHLERFGLTCAVCHRNVSDAGRSFDRGLLCPDCPEPDVA
jgi:hypothetical protein